METKRLKLTYVDYLHLIGREVVTIGNIEIELPTFGWERLQQALDFVIAHQDQVKDFLDPEEWSYCPVCRKDWRVVMGILNRMVTPQELDIRPCPVCEDGDPLKRDTIY